jgi:peptide/nickel transport system substrate-binding protein
MLNKRMLAVAGLVLGLALLGQGPALAKKDTLTVAFSTKFDSLDQYKSTQRENINLGYLIWDVLVERDPKTGKILPHVADSWHVVNPTTWEFKIHPGIRFHNGNPLTAESVRFTLMDRILAADQKSPQAGNYKWIKDVQAVNDHTLRIVTTEPYPLVLERMNVVYIYDPAYTKQAGDDVVAAKPMGSGPYKFVEWQKGSKVVLTANDAYWQKGIPKIKNFVVKIVPESSTRLAELISGGIDVAQDIIPDQVELIQSHPTLAIKDSSILRVNFWQFDSAGRAGPSPVQDVRVRRAIWHAIDRQAIVDSVLKGFGDVTNSSVSPFQFGYDDSIAGYKYDPAEAKRLLKEAGFPNGFEVDLWEYTDIQNLPNQAAMDFLSKVGIKVNLKDYRGNVGQVIKLRNSGKITGIGNFAWGSFNIFDADAILAAFFLNSDNKNYTMDKELDGWLTEARDSVDPAQREVLYKKAQKRIFEQAYWMPFFAQHQTHAHNKDLKYELGTDEVPRYKYAEWLR